MTRREEIMEEAKKHEYDWGVDVDRFDVPDIFAKGAEWMQKQMIEKACEWLMHNVNRYINDEGAGYFRIEKTLLDHFRKAMEE